MGNLNTGDIVQLKSGSPKMTVSHKLNDDVYCIWFDGEDFRNKIFPFLTLQKVYTGD